MNKKLLPLVFCLSCISAAQAVDYQKLSESVDTQQGARGAGLLTGSIPLLHHQN